MNNSPPTFNLLIERLRVVVYYYASAGFLIGIIFYGCGFGPQLPFYSMANGFHAICILLLLLAYRARYISITSAFTLFTLTTQMEISSVMIYMAHIGSPNSIEIILGTMALSGVVLMLSLLTFIPRLPYLQAFLTLVGYITSVLIIKNQSLLNFLYIFLVPLTFITLISNRIMQAVSAISLENNEFREQQDALLTFLHIDKANLLDLIKLLKHKKLTDQQTGELLSLLGKDMEKYILTQVRRKVEKEYHHFHLLEEHAPSLTPSEREVCRLILLDNTVSEICNALQKTESTITSTRSHIRAKLGLSKNDNLKSTLLIITRGESDH